MSEDPEEKLDAAELLAAQLVAQVKKIETDELELPIVDQSCVWSVTVKKLGILDDK
jgi:hypothetical protein